MPKIFRHKPSTSAEPTKPVVTPDFRLTGKVKMVNASAGYVIANFPITTPPAIGQRLSVYRNALKVGELKITGPEPRGGNAVADIVTGEVLVGDEVRGE